MSCDKCNETERRVAKLETARDRAWMLMLLVSVPLAAAVVWLA